VSELAPVVLRTERPIGTFLINQPLASGSPTLGMDEAHDGVIFGPLGTALVAASMVGAKGHAGQIWGHHGRPVIHGQGHPGARAAGDDALVGSAILGGYQDRVPRTVPVFAEVLSAIKLTPFGSRHALDEAAQRGDI